jgi:hypothetical protein
VSLSIADLKRIASDLEAQGARVKVTKKGYIIFCEGGSLAYHLTPSDENQQRQLARDIRNVGLEIPACMSQRKMGKGNA